MTIISFSEIYNYQTCERQYYYRYILNKVPHDMDDAPDTGIKGHRLFQHFYTLMSEGKSKQEALELTTARAAKEMLEGGTADGNLLKAWTLVSNYIEGNDFKYTAILIENRFLLPMSKLVSAPIVDAYGLHDVQIGFTPDIVFERNGGFKDVEDYKFIQKAWSAKKINRVPQVKLYQVFLEAMGYDISRSVLRFFNVKTGEITHKPYTLKEGERATLIHDFTRGVINVLTYKRNTYEAARTMNYNSCQFCKYELPCTLEAEGKSAEKTLKYLFKDGDYDYSK